MSIFGDFNEGLPGDHKKRLVNSKQIGEQEASFDEERERAGADFNSEESLADAPRKMYYFYIVAGLIFATLIFRLYFLQVAQGSKNKFLAEGNRIRTRAIAAARGIVYDQKGDILIKNAPSLNLILSPTELPQDKNQRQKIYESISQITGFSVEEITAKIDTTGLHSLDPIILEENIDHDKALALKEKIVKVSGLTIEETAYRQYNTDYNLSHVYGYVGKVTKDELKLHPDYQTTDYTGKAGLEESYNKELKGQNGYEQVEVDAAGNVVQVMAKKEATPGQNLQLTIDGDLQRNISSIFTKYMSQTNNRKGVVIAMNPQDGSIMGMVSLPSYDNNIFTSITDRQKEYNELANNPDQPLFDRAIDGTYPPGSTIKMLVGAAALQEGVVSDNTIVNDDKGYIDIPNQYDKNVVYRFNDWGIHHQMTIRSAIAMSCDVYFYTVGGGNGNINGLGAKRLEEYFTRFGLGKKTGIDLPDEGVGLVPNADWKKKTKNEDWYQGDTYHESIGQGDLLVTPLQLINYVSAVANGGTVLKPHLVQKIVDSDGKTVKEFGREVMADKIVSDQNIQIVRQGMRQAVTDGTAKSLATLPVPAAGKTGTAQFDDSQSDQAHSWFVTFAPYDNPQIALVVMIEGGGEGHLLAMPIAKDILTYYFTRK